MLSLVTKAKESESEQNDDCELLRAVQSRDKAQVERLLAKGADLGISPDAMSNPLVYGIMTSQYEIASLILNQMTVIRGIIMECCSDLDLDAISVVLGYLGNICQIQWTNSMSDLRLLQLLILHGPRSIIMVKSPDFGEHCLFSAVKNNCQLLIKIVLSIFREELGNDLYSSITSDLNQTLLYHISLLQQLNVEHYEQIMRIFDDYHCRFDQLQSECFGMILSDVTSKYKVLRTYLSDHEEQFPILNNKEFQRKVREMTKENKALLKEKRAELASMQRSEDAKKSENKKWLKTRQKQKSGEITADCDGGRCIVQ